MCAFRSRTALHNIIAANTRCIRFSLQTHFLTHKDNGRVLPTESAVPVSKPLADRFVLRYSVERKSHWKKQEMFSGNCWPGESLLKSATRGRASSAAAFLLGLATCETDGICHNQDKEPPTFCYNSQDYGCWSLCHCKIDIGSQRARRPRRVIFTTLFLLFSILGDEVVTIPSAIVVPADVSLVEVTNSPEIVAEMDSRCHRGRGYWQGSSRVYLSRITKAVADRCLLRGDFSGTRTSQTRVAFNTSTILTRRWWR